MRFPLADWIDGHPECRHQLGSSGMAVSIRHPRPTRSEVRDAAEGDLRSALARIHRVPADRIFLTGGATEANAATLWFLATSARSTSRRCRVRYPEYPSLFYAAEAAGFRRTVSDRAVAVAVISQPRNPEGYLWAAAALDRWAAGARDLVVDETFREFSGAPSVTVRRRPRTWATGSFTKFFGGDDLRVGYVVAPEESAGAFARFHGVLYDELAKYSVAGALACLRALPRVRRDVATVMGANLRALRDALPDAELPVAPLYFDRPARLDGDRLARRCLAASVLVCPGSFFGDPSGVRLCLTRRTFPRDLAAYMSVRDRTAR